MWLITPCCTRRAWQRRALKEGTTSQRLEETGLYREVHLCQGSCRLGRAGVRVTKDWIELLHCQNTWKQSATRWQSHSWPHSGNFWRRKPTGTGTRFYRNCSRSQGVRLQIQYIQVSRCMFQQGGLDSSHDSLVKAGHRIYNAPQILPVPGHIANVLFRWMEDMYGGILLLVSSWGELWTTGLHVEISAWGRGGIYPWTYTKLDKDDIILTTFLNVVGCVAL